MKLKDLIIARKVIYDRKENKIPSRLAYKFMKIMKASDNEDAFYNEKLRALIEEYSIKDEKGKTKIVNGEFRIKANCISDYNAAVAELGDTEVEVPNIKFTLSELEGLSFTVEEIFYLDAFIEE